MNITEVDLKTLWGKAAGRCSYPDCSNNCISYFEKSGDKILGEMAHVIPQSSGGPRGAAGVVGPDTYENLILLCPYHHTMVDKAPDDFPEGLLRRWKQEHELRIERALAGPQFADTKSLFEYVHRLLIENHEIFKTFGPECFAAKANPLCEGAMLWSLRKYDTILPNNLKIVNAFEANRYHLSSAQWKTFVAFREHAFAFAKSTYQRMDRDIVPRFPSDFQEMIIAHAK